MNFKFSMKCSAKHVIIVAILLHLCRQSSAKSALIVLTEDNWSDMLSGEWMVEFFAPWCPACRSLQKDWQTFATWSEDLSINVGAVDVTANPGLSGRFLVTQLPTIYHVKEGVFRQYKGSRDSNAFVNFVEQKTWQSLDPISLWTSPDSVLMSIVSYFFKVSMALRAVHNRLVDDYGIPYWGSYVLFAFVTILFGALLGLLIVCIIDLIFPAKMSDETKDQKNLNSKVKDDDSNDLIDDRIQEEEEEDEETSDDVNAGTELRRRRKTSDSDDKVDD
ncbi:unnamed protein product [Medioppia subpectinata]|uniref:Thioredoxin-related transmembrane protein 1 n=1 Tax=Medioppia subpectinata TaxID=1979941 RepID=A0A7R9KAU9_9ACAR|nr:unnamed protein product [Medioppia subpectinata]CAG2099999.1 unnamed protein product [Medioppia subpectinata]